MGDVNEAAADLLRIACPPAALDADGLAYVRCGIALTSRAKRTGDWDEFRHAHDQLCVLYKALLDFTRAGDRAEGQNVRNQLVHIFCLAMGAPRDDDG